MKKGSHPLAEFNQPLLINILGHAGGALIFAIFLSLLYSGRGWSSVRGTYHFGITAAPDRLGTLAIAR
jgi:hypothetical protein